MKSASRKRTSSIVNLTVKRRYLTEREVERLMNCARKYSRYGHRDATMILVAYRHDLRASEVCDLLGEIEQQAALYLYGYRFYRPLDHFCRPSSLIIRHPLGDGTRRSTRTVAVTCL